ncbi:MAG: tetrahydrofolate dehydrogenase/cyclohydrolase catalytic domain-containing protein, partial [Thermoproteota archaeon]
MTGTKIDGLEVAQAVKERVKKAVEELKAQGINPCLATVLVGDNQASTTYVKNKQKACTEVGIVTKDHHIPSSISQRELNDLVDSLNIDKTIHGILVQLPL